MTTIDARTLDRERTARKILDVRTPAEFDTARIPEAVNIPVDRLDDHAADLAGEVDEPVVLVCRTGQRAEQAQRILAAAGLPQTHVLAGGMEAWQTEGGEVHVEDPRWDLERQVRLVAGGIVATSILASLAWPAARFVAGGVGAGLVVAAATDTCVMGRLLAKLPYNRRGETDPAAACAMLADARR